MKLDLMPLKPQKSQLKFLVRCINLLLLGIILNAAMASILFAQDDKSQDYKGPYLSYEILADTKSANPGDQFNIILKQNIYPKWHTYWTNAGDSGNPTRVTWTAPKGVEISPLVFPSPQRIDLGPLVSFGYEDEVLYTARVTLPTTLPASFEKHTDISDGIKLTANIEALVCKEICIPEFETITFELPIGEKQSINESLFERAKSKHAKTFDYNVNYDWDDAYFNMTVQSTPEFTNALLNSKNVYFFPLEWGIFAYQQTPTILQISENSLTLRFKREDPRNLSELTYIEGILSVDNGTQKTAYQISASPVAGSIVKNEENETGVHHAANISFIAAILLAIGGGLILNLMPCVFPVLSLKALSLSKLGQQEQKQAALHGLSYTAGIMVTFVIIASILFVIKAGGSEIGWGFQFQNHFVVLALAYLLFLIGLNLAGFFDIPSHFAGIGHSLTQKQGHIGSFMTGMLATIVATPCTAPMMGTALGYAILQPPVIGIMVFLALGLGLALPYLALCFIPVLRTKMPKPGAWMNTFKQLLAFPIFAFTVWLVWIFAIQTGAQGVLIALSGMTALTFIIWLLKHLPKGPFGVAVQSFALLLMIGTVGASSMVKPVTLTKVSAKAEKNLDGSWIYKTAKYEELLKTDDPIFVNMTAAWCITCKLNERLALKTQSVKDLFGRLDVQYIKGDWTNYDPEITQYLEKYGRSGVPIYIYYGRRDPVTDKRPDPQILPQLLRPGIVEDTILGDDV